MVTCSSGRDKRMYISHHSLRVKQREQALDFYCNKLGMRLLKTEKTHRNNTAKTHDFLAFPNGDQSIVTQLELISSPEFSVAKKHDDTGYWKIGITLPDIDIATDRLSCRGIAVSAPKQFRDIGYLCHLDDPSGNSIELLQHWFDRNRPTFQVDDDYALGGPAGFGQVTLRIKDPIRSLSFYRDTLGMRLLSRQVVEPYQFTLYFLAFCEENPPVENIDAVENREWLWQRPYTTLELQHRWGTEDSEFTYDTSPESGFESLTFADADLSKLQAEFKKHSVPIQQTVNFDALLSTDAMQVFDPDGYSIRILSGMN